MAGERILLIEHDPPVREQAARMLDQLEFTVFEADNADAGLEVFGNEHPALVLVDEGLPWVGGLDVCARLLTASPELPLVFISPGPMESDMLREARTGYGITHVLIRPFDLDTLARVVRAALAGEAPGPDPEVSVAPAVEPVASPAPTGRTFGGGVPVLTERFVVGVTAMTGDVEAVELPPDEEIDSTFFHDLDPPSASGLRADLEAEPSIVPISPEAGAELESGVRSEDEGKFSLKPMVPTSPTEPQGIYGEVLLGDLLYNVFRDIFTGRLVLQRGGITKSIALRNGFPMSAESNVRSEDLGWRLMLDGALPEAAMRQYRELVDNRGVPPATALVQLGIIGPTELHELQRRMVRERILNCFDWAGASYGLTYDPNVPDRSTGFEVNPLVLIFEGIKRSFPVAPLVAHFDAHGPRPVRRTEKLRDYARLLKDFGEELRMTEMCDGRITVGQLIAQSPFGLIDTLRTLRAFEMMQCLDFQPGEAPPLGRPSLGMAPVRERNTLPGAAQASVPPQPQRAARPSVPPPTRPPVTTAPPAPRVTAPQTAVSSGPPSGPRPAVTEPPPAMRSGSHPAFRSAGTGSHSVESAGRRTDSGPHRSVSDDGLRQQILDRHAVMATATHYEVLDLQPEAAPEAIRAAFMRIARMFHPDHLSPGLDEDLKRRAAELQRRVAQAWEVLGDPQKRAEYDAVYISVPQDTGGKPDIIKAESNFQKGRACLGKGENKRALEFFDFAARQDPHQAVYRIYRGWTRFLCADATDLRAKSDGREEIKNALASDESVDAGYLFLGHISKAAGNDELAERFYRKTLALNPGNTEAQRELRLFDARRREKGKEGLLNRFLGKK